MQKPFNDLELSRYGNLMIKIFFKGFQQEHSARLNVQDMLFLGSFHPKLAFISRNETENQEKWKFDQSYSC